MWFRQRIARPNAPLTGLFRVRGGQGLSDIPDLVDIVRLPAASSLSAELVLPAGVLYTRYFYFASDRAPAFPGSPFASTAYSVCDALEDAVGPLAGRCPILFADAAAARSLHPPEALRSSVTGVWLDRLDNGLLCDLMVASRWQLAIQDWPDGGASTAVFVDRIDPRVRLATVANDVRTLVLDDALRAGVRPVTTEWGRAILLGLERSFPFTVPSEGVRPLKGDSPRP